MIFSSVAELNKNTYKNVTHVRLCFLAISLLYIAFFDDVKKILHYATVSMPNKTYAYFLE